MSLRLNKRLASALRKRDEALVRELCKQGADINWEGEYGVIKGVFLVDAIEASDIEGVRLLLELGAQPDVEHDVFCTLERVIRLYPEQAKVFNDKHLAYFRQYKTGEISNDECYSLQKKLKSDYKKEHVNIKLKIAKMLVDAGATFICLGNNPVIRAMQKGINEYKLILYFLLYCKIDFNEVYKELEQFNKKYIIKTVELWRELAECLKDKKNMAPFVNDNNIDPLLSLSKQYVVKTLKELVSDRHEAIFNNNDAFNCQVIRKYGDSFKFEGNGYLINIKSDTDKILCLIEPEKIENKLNIFWIEEHDIIYILIMEVIKLAFEIDVIEDSNDTYANSYVCNRRPDLNIL